MKCHLQIHVWILRIVNYERTSKTVAILRSYEEYSSVQCEASENIWVYTQMRMIPICSCLIRDMEIMEKWIPRQDGALRHEGGPICPTRTVLKNPVPMLTIMVSISVLSGCRGAYVRCSYLSSSSRLIMSWWRWVENDLPDSNLKFKILWIRSTNFVAFDQWPWEWSTVLCSTS